MIAATSDQVTEVLRDFGGTITLPGLRENLRRRDLFLTEAALNELLESDDFEREDGYVRLAGETVRQRRKRQQVPVGNGRRAPAKPPSAGGTSKAEQGRRTRDAIVEHLRGRAGGARVREIAEALGIGVQGARAQAERLVDEGTLTRTRAGTGQKSPGIYALPAAPAPAAPEPPKPEGGGLIAEALGGAISALRARREELTAVICEAAELDRVLEALEALCEPG